MSLISKPRVLLTGATGRIGTAIIESLSGEWDFITSSLRGDAGSAAEDLTDPVSRERLLQHEFDIVVNAAALSSPALCAADPAGAWIMNAAWPAALATRCSELDVPLIHFSTDHVYGGGVPPYRERSPAMPRSWYGWTKLFGDRMISVRSRRALILRTSVVFGDIQSARMTFSEEILAGRVSRVYVDSWRNHTPVHWLARLLPRMLEKGASGLFIAAAAEAQTRSAFAEALLRHMGGRRSLPELAYANARTPLKLDLRPDRLARLIGTPCPSLEEALELEYEKGSA